MRENGLPKTRLFHYGQRMATKIRLVGTLEGVEESIRNRYKSHVRAVSTNDAFDV